MVPGNVYGSKKLPNNSLSVWLLIGGPTPHKSVQLVDQFAAQALCGLELGGVRFRQLASNGGSKFFNKFARIVRGKDVFGGEKLGGAAGVFRAEYGNPRENSFMGNEAPNVLKSGENH